MSNNSFYVHLFDPDSPSSLFSLGDQPLSRFQFTTPNGYTYPVITNQQRYTAFLHNPTNSNKILKIKSFDFKNIIGTFASGYQNVILARAGGFISCSVEPYQKLDTNAPNLPNGVGVSLYPGFTYTNSGSLRITPAGIFSNPSANNPYFNKYGENSFNGPNLYTGQKTSNIIQDIILAPNQHLMLGISSDTAMTPKVEASFIFSSGSNTYYSRVSSEGNNMPPYYNAANRTAFNIAAFVNNSDTKITIHSIDMNIVYRDLGFNAYQFSSIGSITSRFTFMDHVKSTRALSITDLENSDLFPITSLDSSISLPAGIKCYKHAVQVPSDGNYTITYDNMIAYPVGFRGRLLTLPNTAASINIQDTGQPFALHLLNIFSEATDQDLQFSKAGQEIIIRPGEGLGFGLLSQGSQQDLADGCTTGNILFTVEDIPATETGFGY